MSDNDDTTNDDDQGEKKPEKKIIPPPPSSKSGDSGEDDARFTQADLDARDAAATAKAKRQAEQALADSLGMGVDEAKALIDAQREAEEAQKSDAQRQQEQATKARADAEAMQAEAAREIVKAKLTTALLTGTDEAPGVDPARVETALLLALPAALDSNEDDSIDAAVAFVRSTLPELFDDGDTSQDESGKGKVPPPPGRPAKQQKKQGADGGDGKDSETMQAFKAWRGEKKMAPLPGSSGQ